MLQKYIDGQYRRPSGLVGRWIGERMVRDHQPENLWTVALLHTQPTDCILELGCGAGFAVQELARIVTHGRVVGIDASATMVRAARRRNAQAVAQGRVALQRGDAANLPFAHAAFDNVFSIHSIYFWPQPLRALEAAHRVLKPGGTCTLTVLPKERWNEHDPDMPVGTPECRPYTGAEIARMLVEAGFSSTQIHADPDRTRRSNYSVVGIR
jgi:ubiquinone/menaquinone biosynthesis C-methylase UbiE